MEKNQNMCPYEIIETSRELAQKYTDKILSAINPVNSRDLPFIVFALHTVTEAIEKSMGEEAKAVARTLPIFLGTKHTSINASGAAVDDLYDFVKKKGGGRA